MTYIKDRFGLIWFEIHLGFKSGMKVKVSLQTFNQIRMSAKIRFSSMNSKEHIKISFLFISNIFYNI